MQHDWKAQFDWRYFSESKLSEEEAAIVGHIVFVLTKNGCDLQTDSYYDDENDKERYLARCFGSDGKPKPWLEADTLLEVLSMVLKAEMESVG